MERQGFTPAEMKGAMVPDQKKRVLKTTSCSLWECTLKTLLTTDAPGCLILPEGQLPNTPLLTCLQKKLPLTRSAERLPRLALPVPVGLAEPPEESTEEATEDESTAAEPNCAFAKGCGRFGMVILD